MLFRSQSDMSKIETSTEDAEQSRSTVQDKAEDEDQPDRKDDDQSDDDSDDQPGTDEGGTGTRAEGPQSSNLSLTVVPPQSAPQQPVCQVNRSQHLANYLYW